VSAVLSASPPRSRDAWPSSAVRRSAERRAGRISQTLDDLIAAGYDPGHPAATAGASGRMIVERGDVRVARRW
jgi:hypothetical protein